MATTPEPRFVELRDGPILPAAVVELALALEARGLTLRAQDGVLTVTPRDRITEDDRALIRRWKLHLLALVAYCDRDDLDAHLREALCR
jgi:hypothetical protein